jgi:SAM-dependent methyltransferase
MLRPSVVRLIPRRLKVPLSKAVNSVRAAFQSSRKLFQLMAYKTGVRLGRRDTFIPPGSLHKVGGPHFAAAGQEFLRYFVDLCGLEPHERVLDVGCGTGRMARPLTSYLRGGSYDGTDIVAPSVRWCQQTYTPRYPNFRFHFADIYNKAYNPGGKYRASEYRLPFAASSFDFVFLTSVFTHMLARDMENYLSEVARVLKGDGPCLITYFLLNPDSLKLIEGGLSEYGFGHELGGCRVEYEDVPEAVVAYDEDVIRALYGRCGLSISEPIRYGRWCGRGGGLSRQDMIIAVKN